MSTDAGPAITRYDFTRGALRGTHFTLYASCLVHRGENHLETLPLAAIASLRVAYERDARRLGWGVALLVVALVLFAVSGPLAEFAGTASAEVAAAGASGVARALQGLFRFLFAVANALPFAGVGIALAGVALGVVGWLGNTTLVLDFAGSERVYPVRGRNPGLLDFSEAVCERLMSLKR
jgi:sugar phosphate permease